MRVHFWRYGLIVLICVVCCPVPILAADYKVAYFEAGPSPIFSNTFQAIKQALAEKGWGDRVAFPQGSQFSPGWELDQKETWPQIAQRLMEPSDLDLVISAGTDATGLLLEYNNGHTPILAVAVSDPVRSGFVASLNDSGVDNFTTRIVPERYLRAFRMFHAEVGFKRLGLLYVDNENARKFANVKDAEQVAKEEGFEIVSYKINESRTHQECLTAIETLIERNINAFWIPSLTCFEWPRYDVKRYLDLFIEHRIPTFARQGSEDVRAGALMGFSTVDYSARGQFLADRVIAILGGAQPRSLTMIDKAPPKIAINLFVARKINFDPSFDILGASDEIYQEIRLPKHRLRLDKVAQ
jgi:ABC-type uncharacterized transport system substrate-binding protein